MRAHNQPLILAPFALCGASTSASAVGAVAQVNAEALAGLAFTQLVRPGSPQIYGQFMVTVDMKSGAPMGGTPEAAQMMYLMGALARKYKLPWRTSGFHVGSKLNDAQAGYEANMLMHAAILSGANYIWHVAGWLEAGLCAAAIRNSSPMPSSSSAGTNMPAGCRFDDFKDAMAAVREVGPAGHFLGTQHTLEHFESAFFMPTHHGFQLLRAMVGGRRQGPRHARPREGARHARRPMRSRSSTRQSLRPCAISSPGASVNCRWRVERIHVEGFAGDETCE